jgi:hypothetical protein
MKFYTIKSTNIVFTVKEGSNISDLIEVKDIIKHLRKNSSNRKWLRQLFERSCSYQLALTESNCVDSRIDKVVDIVTVEELKKDDLFSLGYLLKYSCYDSLELDYV